MSKIKSYGVPYKGSKNKLAERVVALLPQGGTLYDVFAGGCAITDCALRQNKYKNYVLNDISNSPSLFVRAYNGEDFGKEWISHDDFFARKDTDPYVRLCWSFGNDSHSYMYGHKIEPYKKALHYAVLFNDYSGFKELMPEVHDYVKENLSKIDINDTQTRHKVCGKLIVQRLKEFENPDMLESKPLYKQIRCKKDNINGARVTCENIQRLQSLQSLQSLQRLQRLQSLQRLEGNSKITLTVKQGDYHDLEFTDPSGVIYCDPPYKGTSGYTSKKSTFDYEEFYRWCESQTLPVFISEYSMPEDRFVCIAKFNHISSLCSSKTIKTIEKVFVPKHQYKPTDW